jgi:hypothetical protein
MNAARLWPIALIGTLGATVVANVVMLRAASDRSAYVVEHDYYRKGVDWDSTLAQRRRDAALGWNLDARIAAAGAGAILAVSIVDRAGAAIGGAEVTVVAIHNRAPQEMLVARIRTGAEGRGETMMPLGHAGLWELRFDVRHGVDRFTVTLRRDLDRGATAATPEGRP